MITKKQEQEIELALSDLQKVPLVLLPRPYPPFQPYWFEAETNGRAMDLDQVESIQISIGPGLDETALTQKHGFALQRIILK